MDNFIVSARKYRPTTFNSVVGQEHITSTLKNAIKTGQIAQSFLFCGPRGVGKTTCARIFAKALNCQHLTVDFEPCNECDSCRAYNESASFNVYELDAASNNSVDDIRSLVEQVRIAPQGAKYKVYVIDEVHMLSSAAFNAFLKTLEEPPAYAKFILATTEKHKIIPWARPDRRSVGEAPHRQCSFPRQSAPGRRRSPASWGCWAGARPDRLGTRPTVRGF